MSEKPKKADDIPNRTSIVENGLTKLLSENKLPYCLIDVYEISVIMTLLFEPLKMGEVFRNLKYQIEQVMNLYDYKPESLVEELKPIYQKYVKIILDRQQELQKDIDESVPKKAKK